MNRLLAVGAIAIAAQVPVSELATPPANARHFIIQSTGGKHGDSWSWTTPDGARMGRESMNLRGQVFELDSRGLSGRDGMPASMTVRGVTPSGDAGETFTIAGGTASWKSPIDEGKARYSSPEFYSAQTGPIDLTAWFLEALLARPDKTLNLLPGGTARAEKLTDMQVGDGAGRQTITLWSVSGLSTTPVPLWADARNRFFAITLGIDWLPETYVGEQKRMEDVQAKAVAAVAPGLAKQLTTVPSTPVAFTGVRLFDADALRFVPDQTVVVDKGRIVAVGSSSRTAVP
ncbi:MAG TPA: hypothetical protein VEU08_17620, partial [Vicinamibacterales bacterium]|nr:hypothetical protein [Vicinamibacterales bacterium]